MSKPVCCCQSVIKAEIERIQALEKRAERPYTRVYETSWLLLEDVFEKIGEANHQMHRRNKSC